MIDHKTLTDEQMEGMSDRALSGYMRAHFGIKAGQVIVQQLNTNDRNREFWYVEVLDTDIHGFQVRQHSCGPWDDKGYVEQLIRRQAYEAIVSGRVQ